MTRWCWLACLLLGCGSDVDPHLCPDGRHAIGIDVGGKPILAVYRDGDADWEVPALAGNGIEWLCVEDDYVFFVACGQGSYHFTEQIAATSRDSDHSRIASSCLEEPPPSGPEPSVHVTGTIHSPATVWLATKERGQSDFVQAGMFATTLIPGTYNLVVNDARRVLARRNLRFTKDISIGDIDLATEGSPLNDVALDLIGLSPDDQVMTTTWWGLGDSLPIVLAERRDAVVQIPPVPIRTAGDTMWIDLSAAGPTQDRAIELVYRGETFVTLPPPLTTATFGDASVTWTSLPAYTDLFAYFDGNGSLQTLSASRRWMDRHPRMELALEPDIPGYDPAWLPQIESRRFSVVDNSGEGYVYNSISEDPAP